LKRDEYGIGLIQKDFKDIAFEETNLNLMRSIKKVFEPNNILNPVKYSIFKNLLKNFTFNIKKNK
jgi:FAD/FMN-containing dehydrogenase